jgi:deoxyhypusine monooxygenase
MTDTHHHHHEEEYTEEEFAQFDDNQLSTLLGNDNIPVSQRMRMLWYLKALEDKQRAIRVLSGGLVSQSVLLKHEICYVFGQLKDVTALPILNDSLANLNEDCMVRHEAGEALGAIGAQESIPVLKLYLNDPVREVRETCELAIENIEHNMKKTAEEAKNEVFEQFTSVDPAPPTYKYQKKTISELRDIYLDLNASLFVRYKAMFALRNKSCTGNYEEQVQALNVLSEGFRQEEGALFKHEIAFVFGQLQRQETATVLERVLRDTNEHAMVRHEAAEALGSICDPNSLKILNEFQSDSEAPVSDSCVVAIDMHNYWSKFVIPTTQSDD